MNILVSLLIVIEIAALNLGFYLGLRKKIDSIARSLSYSAILTLATLSFSIQAFFITGIPGLYFLTDIAIIIFFLFQSVKNVDIIKNDSLRILRFLQENKLISFVFLPVMVYLFLQAFLLPPVNADSMVYNLARVLMFKQEGSLFLNNFSTPHQAAFPVGFDILPYLFLRFNSDFGPAVFSFMSYLVIITATFSLVGRMFGKKQGATISIIIASLTELVLLSTTTKNDIPTAAVTVVIFLAAHKFLADREPIDLYIIIISVLWGLTIKSYFAGFVLPFIVSYSVLFIKTHSFKDLFKSFSYRVMKPNYMLILPVGLLVCMVFFHVNNLERFGNIWGEENFIKYHQNNDGIVGGVLNAGRYIAQSAEIPIKYGYKLNEIHDGFLKDSKFKGMRDKNEPIDLAAKLFISEDYAWFGPFGFFLVLPCVLFSLCFAGGYVRAVAVTLSFYFIIISYQVAWMPWNGRFFSLFFAGSGICVAYVFDRFLNKKRSIARGCIVIIAVYGLLSATLQNDLKSSVPKYHSLNLVYNLYRLGAGTIEGVSPKKGFMLWIKNLSDRKAQYNRFFPPHMPGCYISSIERGKRVLVIGYFSPVFPLLFLRPDLDITVATVGKVSIGGAVYNLNNEKDYRFIHEQYDYIIFLTKIIKLDVYKYVQDEDRVFYAKEGSIYKFK